MPLRTIHLCPFNPKDQDIRVVGTEIDGGTSIAGITDTIAIDGGGYWQADWSGFDFGGPSDVERDETLAWRATQAGLSGGARAIIPFCDRHHQPVYALETVPHGDDTSFDDSAEYASPGAECTVVAVNNGQDGGLNCTSLDISIASERALRGGERFTYVHEAWLDRCAEIISVDDSPDNAGALRITFQPPVRGGISVGDPLDFDDPRCVMRRSSAPSNALSIGLFSAPSGLTMVEDMRDPDA